MAERLTVVFESPGLYRRLKVFAAERGVPMKQVIEDALMVYLEGESGEAPAELPGGTRTLDWDRWDSFQAELDAIAEPPGMVSASDVKHELYGLPARELTERGWRYVAEEPAPYDAGGADLR